MPLKKISKTENNLKKLLIAKGMSMKALAYTLGISTQQIQKYVSGENEPTLENLAKIARVFGCRTQDIYPFLKNESTSTKHGENVIINNYYGFLSGVLKMDMSLLKNKIIFLVINTGIILSLVITYFGFSFLDKSDIYQYALAAKNLNLLVLTIVSITLMIVYTLTFATTFISYGVSLLAYGALVFRIYHTFFGLVGDNEVKRWGLRLLALILAIIWVHVAKKIREKV